MCAGSHRVRFPPPSFSALEHSVGKQPKDQWGWWHHLRWRCRHNLSSCPSQLTPGRRTVRRAAMVGFRSSIKLFRSWLAGHQAGNPSSSSSSGHFDSPSSSLVPSRGHHHRSYAPYPIPSTYGFNVFYPAMGLLSRMCSQQFDRHPFLFPPRKSWREVVYAEVWTDTLRLLRIPAHVSS
jgi:hypothetical protein